VPGLLILLFRMRCSTSRLASATLLLAVMLFTALPRTFFHHCEEGASSADLHILSGTLHANTHCPICEAPFPNCDGVADLSFHMEEALLGTRVILPALVPVYSVPTTLRLRGPPKLS